MSSITKNDLKSFAKVLSALGEQISNNPDDFMKLINSLESEKDKPVEVDIQLVSSQVDEFDLFTKMGGGKQSEIEEFLNGFSSKELSFINKHLKFPYIRSKSKNTILTEIVDQLKKRTESVFRNHE